MTDRALLHQLRRGIGVAIQELRRNPDRPGAADLVLRCCLKNIGYDTQVEGSKGYYLYTAVAALGRESEFLSVLTSAYEKRLPHQLFEQLTDLLCAYAEHGFPPAEAALRAKYDRLNARLKSQLMFPYRYCEREQFETLMTLHLHLDKWRGFRSCVDDAGGILLARSDDHCGSWDWFLSCAEGRFGKTRVWNHLNALNASPETRAFADAFRETARSRESFQTNLAPVTVEQLLGEVHAQVDGRRPHGVIGLCMRFAREADEAALLRLAAQMEAEENRSARAQLLRVFYRRDYPAGPGPLLDWARSGHGALREAAVAALGRFKDPRIHELAAGMVAAGQLEQGLTLLIKNWKSSDDALIAKAVLSSRRVEHAVEMDLRDIYTAHRSASCDPALLHAYRNGECAFCRHGIVRAMAKNGVLPDALLEECRYDSYEKTRLYAERLMARRDRVGEIF